MSNTPISVKLVLKDSSGKEIGSATIDVPPGTHEFSGLPPGRYSVTCSSALDVRFLFKNPIERNLTNEKNSFPIYLVKVGGGIGGREEEVDGNRPSGGSDRPPPIPEAIAVTALSLTLMGNIALFEDFVLEDFISSLRPNRTAQTEQTQPPSESELRDPRNRLPPAVEERLRECLKASIKRLVNFPELTKLVQTLTEDNENLNTDFQVEVRRLYEKVKQLRQTIEECDPSLIRELMNADEKITEQRQEREQNACDNTATIVGQLVNVRAFPSPKSEIVAQFAYGSCIQLDVDALALFSDEQRSDAESGEGWYPIILPDGSRGYVYSRYVSRTLDYRF